MDDLRTCAAESGARCQVNVVTAKSFDTKDAKDTKEIYTEIKNHFPKSFDTEDTEDTEGTEKIHTKINNNFVSLEPKVDFSESAVLQPIVVP